MLQDGDYLILPEVIQTLHAHISEFKRPSAVHLLRHGTMMHRSLASEILSLIQVLNFSKGGNEDGR